jgi:hypothetical protein
MKTQRGQISMGPPRRRANCDGGDYWIARLKRAMTAENTHTGKEQP